MGRSGGQELVSLSSEFGKHLSSIVMNLMSFLNNNYNQTYDIFNFISNFISLSSNSITCICKIIELIPCIKLNLSPEKYLCRPNLRDFETCLNEINTKINDLKTKFCCIQSKLICIKCYLSNIRSIDIYTNNHNRYLVSLNYYYCLIRTNVSSIDDYVDKSKSKITELKELRVYFNKLIKCSDWFTCQVTCNSKKIIILQYFKHVKSQIEKLLCHIGIITNNFDIIQCNSRFLKHSNEFTIVILQLSNNLIYKFIQCSLLSLSNHLINLNMSTNSKRNYNMGVLEINNLAINLMSTIAIDKSIFVLSMIYMYYKTKNLIDETLQILEGCVCVRIYNRDWSDKIETFDKPLPNVNARHYSPTIISLMMTHTLNDGNYMCLCLVVRYILLNDLYVLMRYHEHLNMDMLSCMSRSYKKYSHSICSNFNVSKLIMLIVVTLDKIILWMRKRLTGYKNCYCANVNSPYYGYLISTILFVSSLVENVWTMDTEIVMIAINCLSSLLSDYESIRFYTGYYSGLGYRIYSLLVHKECQPKSGKKCCCCWCVTVYNLLIMCISLCIQCKLCKALCNQKKEKNGCKMLEEFCKVEECNCTCTQNQGNGVCCLLQLALSKAVSCSVEELKKKLEKCCEECRTGNGCCKNLSEKVDKGLCKVLVLGCECTCTTTGGATEVKGKCVFFNDLSERTRVAVVVFCKCGQPAKECCLYKLIGKLEGKLKSSFQKICNDRECVCDELKNVCDEIGCTDCAPECVCKKLEAEWKKICGENTGKCLCKEMEECLKNLCTKKVNCKCNEKGCCRCVCCKIVAHSIKILTRACRANVLEPYKRITLQLLNCGKVKEDIMRSIVKRINQTTLNRMYLVKNNVIIGSYEILNTKNTVKSRNWGYDSQYEHQVTTKYKQVRDGYTNNRLYYNKM